MVPTDVVDTAQLLHQGKVDGVSEAFRSFEYPCC